MRDKRAQQEGGQRLIVDPAALVEQGRNPQAAPIGGPTSDEIEDPNVRATEHPA